MKPKLMCLSSYLFASNQVTQVTTVTTLVILCDMVFRKDMSADTTGMRHLCVSSYVLG
jgi:hypothetical protein